MFLLHKTILRMRNDAQQVAVLLKCCSFYSFMLIFCTTNPKPVFRGHFDLGLQAVRSARLSDASRLHAARHLARNRAHLLLLPLQIPLRSGVRLADAGEFGIFLFISTRFWAKNANLHFFIQNCVPTAGPEEFRGRGIPGLLWSLDPSHLGPAT